MTTEGRNVIPAARSDRHVIFILLAAAQLVFVVQFGMVSVALQDLTSDLHAPLRWAGWVLTIFQLGQIIDVNALDGTAYVDVVGTSKGKGFAGNMKRNNFKGMSATHGTERKHRTGGSIGSHGTDRGHGAKIKKGKRMSGHMGDERVTVRSLDVVKIDVERNLLLVKGPVPGANDGYLFIRPATRLFKRKSKKLTAK